MKKIINTRNQLMSSRSGMVLLLVLIFATILLQFAISYSGMLRQAKPQTIQVDEKAKLICLANSLIDKAILKFRLYPSDYYAAVEAAQRGYSAPLNAYTLTAPELSVRGFAESTSSFNATTINVAIATMALLTNAKWDREAMRIEAYANYSDQYGHLIQKNVVRVIATTRRLVH